MSFKTLIYDTGFGEDVKVLHSEPTAGIMHCNQMKCNKNMKHMELLSNFWKYVGNTRLTRDLLAAGSRHGDTDSPAHHQPRAGRLLIFTGEIDLMELRLVDLAFSSFLKLIVAAAENGKAQHLRICR